MPHPHYETGPYKAVITSQRFGTTPTESDFFAIEFEPTEASAANQLPAQIYRRELTLYMTEKAITYSIEKLRRLGWNGAKLAELEPNNPNCHSLAGIEIDVVMALNDKGYEDWNLAAPGSGQAPKESEQGVASKLDKLFGKTLMASVPAGKKAAPKKKAETVPPADDDEVPF
jgi:hypothetical protein